MPPRIPKNPPNVSHIVGAIDLSHIDPRKVNRIQGRLPPKTNIKSLGISTAAVSQLTSAAAKLTKEDLESLRGPHATAVQQSLGLTVKDINSIKTAFAGPIQPGGIGPRVNPAVGGGVAMDVSCCCCTPCCCAAAHQRPVNQTA